MDSTIPIFTKCHNCGKEKRLTTNEIYSTIGMRSYSDRYNFFPAGPPISEIQVCRECETPYLLRDVETREADKPEDFDGDEISTGRIPFVEVKALTLPYLPLPQNKSCELFLREEFLYSYNHAFRGLEADAFVDLEVEDDMVRTKEDEELHHKNLEAMIEILESPESPFVEERDLYLAELYRELGKFDKTIELLKDFKSENLFFENYAKQIRQKAMDKVSTVFEFDQTGEKIMVVL